MPVQQIDIEDFVTLARKCVVIDVRSPKEFSHAHFPKALSIPLFSDGERAEIGTAYKKQNRKTAVKIGLDYFGPKMKSIVSAVETALSQSPQKQIILYCWRGGMRSAAVAWLLDFYGFKVSVLNGGYKRFRNWVLSQFNQSYSLMLLDGFTGSGKTEILLNLSAKGHAVVDLEGLAGHKGSAFGNLNKHSQISTEQFENDLAMALFLLTEKYSENDFIWMEAESIRIGDVNIPNIFFNQMKAAPRMVITIPFASRLNFILKKYGHFDVAEMIAATQRITKRFGSENTKQVITFLQQKNIERAFNLLLHYYDKCYAKSSAKLQPALAEIPLPTTEAEKNMKIILKKTEEIICRTRS